VLASFANSCIASSVLSLIATYNCTSTKVKTLVIVFVVEPTVLLRNFSMVMLLVVTAELPDHMEKKPYVEVQGGCLCKLVLWDISTGLIPNYYFFLNTCISVFLCLSVYRFIL